MCRRRNAKDIHLQVKRKRKEKGFKNVQSTPDNSKLALTHTEMDFPVFLLDFRQTLERLSMTFTANGKNETVAVRLRLSVQ